MAANLLELPRSLLPLFLVGAVERAYGEVEKEDSHGGVDDDLLVVGAGAPVGAQPVGALNEEEAEEREEASCDFEPEDAAGVDERAPEGFAESLAAALEAGGGGLDARGVDGGVPPGGLRGMGGAVAQHHRGDARADSEFPAYAKRLHESPMSKFYANDRFALASRKSLRDLKVFRSLRGVSRRLPLDSDCRDGASQLRWRKYPERGARGGSGNGAVF